jgi:hydrogenase assembly chaperone HypC/HupF
MCLAIPGKIKLLLKGKAVIQYPGQEREAYLSDISVVPGDYVIVQMGIVTQKLTEDQAKEMYKGWDINY